jgi:hypothetical protein
LYSVTASSVAVSSVAARRIRLGADS